MHQLSNEELLEEVANRFQQNKQIIEELQSLTDQLQQVNEKLKESESLKTNFISNITNEIVNPFASILGLSKHITSIGEGKSNQIKKMAELIYKEAFSLDFQFKNIFAAAEIEAGEMYPDISNVDIKKLIESIVEYFKEEAETKQITVLADFIVNDEFGGNFHFKTDAEKISLMLRNLLSNSIKFSPSKSTVLIHSCIENGFLIISLKDEGIGIDANNRSVIFDRFKRVDAQINSINRGHGLGLAIVKAILDVLEGGIEIEGEKGAGSVFTVKIPEVSPKTKVDDYATDGNEVFFGDNEIF